MSYNYWLQYIYTCAVLLMWAYSCVCRAPGEALYIAPISYHQPALSDYNNSSHLNLASGSGSLSSSIPLAQSHSNNNKFVHITPPVFNSQPTGKQPSSSNPQKWKATQNPPGTSSSKWSQYWLIKLEYWWLVWFWGEMVPPWVNNHGMASTIREHMQSHNFNEWKSTVLQERLKDWEKIN